MENAKDQKTYTAEDVLVARYLGRKEAEEYLQARISQIAKTNHELLAQIMNLESLAPVDGVLMPYAFVGKVVEKLRETNPNDYHAKMLKYYMNRADREMLECREKALQEIENG